MVRFRAEEAAEDRILDVLLTPARHGEETEATNSSTRQLLRKKLREGDLDDREVEIELSSASMGVEIMAPPGMEEMTSQLQGMFSNLAGQQKKTSTVTVRVAFDKLRDEEAAKLVNEDELKQRALQNAEQTGIVFLDELDKVAKRSEGAGADVSREGHDFHPHRSGTIPRNHYFIGSP